MVWLRWKIGLWGYDDEDVVDTIMCAGGELGKCRAEVGESGIHVIHRIKSFENVARKG